MSDLLKRADNLNALNDGISGHNQIVVDLVNELAARVRELEARIAFSVGFVEDAKAGDAAVSWDAERLIKALLQDDSPNPIVRDKAYAKKIATDFFRYWWNKDGTNTDQGFEQYWRELRMVELGITEEDVAETKFPPDTARVPTPWPRKPNSYCNEPITLENLKSRWLFGSTCHREDRISVHWVSDDGQWIVMKHKGHTEWCGGWTGQSYCGTHYDLFRVGDQFPEVLGGSPYFTQEGRWSKKSMEWVEKVMAGWRPDGFVETQ